MTPRFFPQQEFSSVLWTLQDRRAIVALLDEQPHLTVRQISEQLRIDEDWVEEILTCLKHG